MPTRGRGRGRGKNILSRDERGKAPSVTSLQLRDEPIDEPIDEPQNNEPVMNDFSSHSLDDDIPERETPANGSDSTVDRRFRGQNIAPRQPEDLDQRIPVIIHRNTLVVPEQENGIKFPSVAAGITNAIQGKFVVGEKGPTWKKLTDDTRDYYYKDWNNHYKLVENYPSSQVRKIWNKMASHQYKLMCHRGRQQFGRNGHPPWSTEQDWNRHLLFYANEEMRKKCEKARKNRNSDCNGLGKTKHSGGSRSFASHELAMIKENPDKVITEDDVFLRTHKRKKGVGEFVDAKSKKTFEDYIARKKGPGFDSSAWVDASGGVVKNRLYGFGSLPASNILSGNTSSSYASPNVNLTQTQQFEDKVREKVEEMRNDIRTQLKTELQSEHMLQIEQLKSDFQLQLQEAVRSLKDSL